MAVHFADTSALAKSYVRERGSNWVGAILDPQAAHAVYVAEVSGVELVSALTRRSRSGSISAVDAAAAIKQCRQDFRLAYHVVGLDAGVIDLASDLAERHGLRAYDAVHLASALVIHRAATSIDLAVTILSSDLGLNTAALAEGLVVEDPNDHPSPSDVVG